MVKKSIEDDTESEMDEEEIQKAVAESTEEKVDKRAINYQIEKNKGLTPRRNKMYRNPRVRNRVKAHRAIVKRKSIVPVRTQEKRYSGEATGIRMSVVRGVKIK
jgi:U3 small nucleolar RNA-associated protein 3